MNTNLPSLDLYKANIELQLRITRLLQDAGREWLEAVQRSNEEGVSEATTEIEGLLNSANWQALTTLPGEAFWRLFQQRSGDVQALNQAAIERQAAFTAGLQQALENWQKAVTEAVGEVGALPQPFQDLLKQWGVAWTLPVRKDKAAVTKGGANRGN
ncbi:hypothetical protein [Thauera linaloolentis]|uniref:Phasin domain-containing protein n=1 Tax=Thauera linaloolentis (strain DSM 12138 / JCM 21573 / CCUG 41526 / CIP 105981 / IAM 15112 / NBRC 102519 / 47Lol) TaxID=1123367 RepID=N6Z449_THAL4|nr:hypothetical protein [Thauera linaloolentis]ENO89352.1 hypothetical protein C666_06675 [Thauera linaloolentis 47Lol = DSM 12138]MCM8564998.1 hypothetical protein [Thauera linaloolentis]